MKPLTLIEKAFALKRTLLFNSLDLDLLLAVADKLKMAVFTDGQSIFNAQEEANRMYFIIGGQVEIQSSQQQSCYFLSSGDFFGEESLFNNQLRAYSAMSIQESTLLTLSRANLYTIISECPAVAVGFLQVYSSSIECRHDLIKGVEK